jgi:hypothetical protein
MAMIERITLSAQEALNSNEMDYNLSGLGLPGLRISTRATTSSLSDYPEWNVEDLYQRDREMLITDGTCS